MEFFFILIIIFTFLSIFYNPNKNKSYRINENINIKLFNENFIQMINIKEIERIADEMKQTKGTNDLESIFFSVTSLIDVVNINPAIDKPQALSKVYLIINKHYPELLNFIRNYNKDFDFISHIALNADIIGIKEHKDRREALYLTICMIYDDLRAKRSNKGLQDLVQTVKIIYPDLFNELLTYIAWNYQEMQFKPEFDLYMRKRHAV